MKSPLSLPRLGRPTALSILALIPVVAGAAQLAGATDIGSRRELFVDEALVERVLLDSGTVEGSVVAAAFAFRDGGAGAIGDALEAELSHARKELDKGMNFLGTIGNNAPFIGLLGTVIGVIVAFKELGTAAGNQAAMGNVMTGIAEALVATGVGLFVALPAVIAFNIATKRIGDIEQDAQALGRLVAAWLEIRGRGGVIHQAGEDGATVRRGAPLPPLDEHVNPLHVPIKAE